MRIIALALVLVSPVMLPAGVTSGQNDPPRGRLLEALTWPEAERQLTPESIVVIPLGAAAKEHGPHLRLRNDLTLAEYLTTRVHAAADVVIAPTLAYHYYPAFVEYPGSTTLSLSTAQSLTVEVARSLARYGPRRFYVLNTGISTNRPLAQASETLAAEGILLRHTDLDARLEPVARTVRQQEGGTHADEIETSMMLYIDPAVVDMTKAVKDYSPRSQAGGLTRSRNGRGTYSPTGIWGDPTLATPEKGRVLVEGLVSGILEDIEAVRRAALPPAAPTSTSPNSPLPVAGRSRDQRMPSGCTVGDERAIQAIGTWYSIHWNNGDAERLTNLWAEDGDLGHPDGVVERSRIVIRRNRERLFSLPEYRGSRHLLKVGEIRCVSEDVAVADGVWELRGVTDGTQQMPTLEGLFTIVVKRSGGWQIQAYRYNVTPTGAAPPTLLSRPGYPGGVIKE